MGFPSEREKRDSSVSREGQLGQQRTRKNRKSENEKKTGTGQLAEHAGNLVDSRDRSDRIKDKGQRIKGTGHDKRRTRVRKVLEGQVE